jgi:hypothetical protein
MGYTRFSADNFSVRFCRSESGVETAARDAPCEKDGLLIGQAYFNF